MPEPPSTVGTCSSSAAIASRRSTRRPAGCSPGSPHPAGAARDSPGPRERSGWASTGTGRSTRSIPGPGRSCARSSPIASSPGSPGSTASCGTGPGRVTSVICGGSIPEPERCRRGSRCRPAWPSPGSSPTAASCSSAEAGRAARCGRCGARGGGRRAGGSGGGDGLLCGTSVALVAPMRSWPRETLLPQEDSMRRPVSLLLTVCLLAVTAAGATAQSKEPVKIGLTAAVTGGSAASGEAIKRGLEIAIAEVNAKGGVLNGRPLQLIVRDDEGQPAKGVTIARELVEREKVAAVFGGLHTPVALAQVAVWQELKTPYMGAWAAGTNITRNGQSPNYVFRVSANDDDADKFLTRYATEVLRKGKPGLLLENTSWGQSNEAGLAKWLGEKGIRAVGIEKFNWGDPDMSPQLLRL